jgi:hypothetical protein
MSEIVVERYTVLKTMHMGAIGRNLNSGSVIEWEPDSEVMKIDGNRLIPDKGINPSEAMRQLRALDGAIEPLESNKGFETSGKLATKTLCIVPILSCIAELMRHQEERGVPVVLTPVNGEQAVFIDSFGDMMDDVVGMDCVSSKSSIGADGVNQWLRSEGFDIQLDDVGPELCVASVMRVLIEWLYAGNSSVVTGADGKDYEAVSMKSNGVTISHVVQAHKYPVIRVAGKSGETVCMSMIDEMPTTQEGMFLKISELDGVRAASHQFEGVSFPKIDLDDQPDIGWISGLGISKGMGVHQAKQQTRFKMDEKGAKVESAAAVSTYRSMASRKVNHVIDRPFMVWVMRPELDFPVFASVVCEDVWVKA